MQRPGPRRNGRNPVVCWAVLLLALFSLVCPLVEAQAPPRTLAADFVFEPPLPLAGQVVGFESTSRAHDSPIVNWTWSFGDNGTAYGPRASHTYAAPGDYVVELRVRDGTGNETQVGRWVTVRDAGHSALSFLPPWSFWVMPLFVGGVLLYLGYMVMWRGQPTIYNLVFFLFYTVSAIKSLTESFSVLTAASGGGLHGTLRQLNAASAYLMVGLFLWFVLVFPRPVHPWLREGKRGAVAIALTVPFLLGDLFAGWVGWDYGDRVNVFNAFASIVVLVCLGLLVYHAWETDSEEERRRIRLLSFTFIILVGSTLILTAINLTQASYARAGDAESADFFVRVAGVFGLIVSPFLEIVAASMLMYAILRYQLLGIESVLAKATRTTLIALCVPSIFIIVSNSIEQLFQETVLQGIRFDFVIAGFFSAMFMLPIEKWTTFIVYRLMPGLKTKEPEFQAIRRMEVYEAQLRYCLLDGALNPKEVDLLQRLEKTIQIPPEEVRRVATKFPAANLAGLLPPETAAPPKTGPVAARLAFAPMALPIHVDVPFTVKLHLLDAQGGLVAQDETTVRLGLAYGRPGATLHGTTERRALDGVATFDDVRFEGDGEFALLAQAADLVPVQGAPLVPLPTPSRLEFHDAPTGADVGEPLRLRVRFVDPSRQPDLEARSPVTLFLEHGPEGARLEGVLTRFPERGEAGFDDVRLSPAGRYRLGARSTGYLETRSSTIVVQAAAPSPPDASSASQGSSTPAAPGSP